MFGSVGRGLHPRLAVAAVRRVALAGALSAVAWGTVAAIASADGTTTINGSPLIVSIGTLGECQSNYLNGGYNFFPSESTLGDCGFFLGFPATDPAALRETVYGFEGEAGPHLKGDGEGGQLYTAFGEQGPVTGTGSAATPYEQVTTFAVVAEGKAYALITETTTYVNGQAQFTSTYDVWNVTGQTVPGLTTAAAAPLRFHAIYAGDLFTNNSDFGTGVFLGGPPLFIGGQNNQTGVLGGFIQNGEPWTNYSTGCWNGIAQSLGRCEPHLLEDFGIWEDVRRANTSAPVFNNSVDPNLIDNAAGVSWDTHLETPLKANEHASYSIINRAQVPTTLGVQPVNQTLTQGQAAAITVTATDSGGTPYANRPLVYSVNGSNGPATGSVMTDGSGVATISYAGANAGLDVVQMFLDLEGNGTQAPQDPAGTAQITWLPKPVTPGPPAPNSTYKVQSIHANSNGTITIVFVPAQPGQATLEVTVPTGTIARKQAEAAKQKCKKGLVRIKGKCRKPTTLSGKITATGVAGLPLKLTVGPSSKVKAALKKGRTVKLTAKLTYKSVYGGNPTVKTFVFTVKPPRKHKKH